MRGRVLEQESNVTIMAATIKLHNYKSYPCVFRILCSRGSCNTAARGSQLFAKNFDFEFLFSFFFHCRSFFTLLAASISHFITAITKFSSFFQRNSSPLLYFSRHCSFSVIHVSVDIKIWSKKRLALLLLFLSKCPSGHAICHQNERVLECEISLRLTCRGVRTDESHVIVASFSHP